MGWTCPLCLGAACESGRRSVVSRGEQCLSYTFWERPALALLRSFCLRFGFEYARRHGAHRLWRGHAKRIIDKIVLSNQWFAAPYSSMRTRVVFLTHGHLDHTWGLLPLLQTLDLDGRRAPLVVMGPSTQAAIDWATQHPGESPPADSGISSTDLAILFSQWQTIGTKDHESSYQIDWVLIPLDGDEPFKSPIQPLEGVTVTIRTNPSWSSFLWIPFPNPRKTG